MARAELKAALKSLLGYPGFREYVSTLESAYADVMTKILMPDHRLERDELCAEARVYRDILKSIELNIK